MEKYNVIEIGDFFSRSAFILVTNTFLLPSFSASFRIFAQTTASYLCVVEFSSSFIPTLAVFFPPPFLFHFMWFSSFRLLFLYALLSAHQLLFFVRSGENRVSDVRVEPAAWFSLTRLFCGCCCHCCCCAHCVLFWKLSLEEDETRGVALRCDFFPKSSTLWYKLACHVINWATEKRRAYPEIEQWKCLKWKNRR